jgi:hypothetical protein
MGAYYGKRHTKTSRVPDYKSGIADLFTCSVYRLAEWIGRAIILLAGLVGLLIVVSLDAVFGVNK